VEAYYSRFITQLMGRQKRFMSSDNDMFIYNYIFLEGLRNEVAAEVFRLPESQSIETLTLAGLYGLATHGEQISKFRIRGGRKESKSSNTGPNCGNRRRGNLSTPYER
jgi:hypothetical protein